MSARAETAVPLAVAVQRATARGGPALARQALARELRHLVTPCLIGSGSQQIAKYRSDLQELTHLVAAARRRGRSDGIGLCAAIGLELGKQ